MPVRSVHHKHVHTGVHQSLDALVAVCADGDRGRDDEALPLVDLARA